MSFYFCETYCTLSPNSLGFPIFLGTVEAPAPKAPPKRVASQPGRSPKGYHLLRQQKNPPAFSSRRICVAEWNAALHIVTETG